MVYPYRTVAVWQTQPHCVLPAAPSEVRHVRLTGPAASAQSGDAASYVGAGQCAAGAAQTGLGALRAEWLVARSGRRCLGALAG